MVATRPYLACAPRLICLLPAFPQRSIRALTRRGGRRGFWKAFRIVRAASTESGSLAVNPGPRPADRLRMHGVVVVSHPHVVVPWELDPGRESGHGRN